MNIKKFFGNGFFCFSVIFNYGHQSGDLLEKNFLSFNDLVFDIGANTGAKTEQYLSYGAHVVCVEPQPACLEILKQKFSTNKRVKIVPYGIANYNKQLKFFICSSANTISTFSSDWVTQGRFKDLGYQWDATVEVACLTLDELLSLYGTPKFCKIDTENFEYEVISGLSKPIPYISFEFAWEFFENTKKCLDHLTTLGYIMFNFSIAEQNKFETDWVSSDQLEKILQHTAVEHPLGNMFWGDIYAKFG